MYGSLHIVEEAPLENETRMPLSAQSVFSGVVFFGIWNIGKEDLTKRELRSCMEAVTKVWLNCPANKSYGHINHCIAQ